MSKFKTILIVLLAGAVIALVLMQTCKKTMPVKPVIIPPAVIEKQVKAAEDSFKGKFDSVQAVIHARDKVIGDIKAKYLYERKRAEAAENAVNYLQLDDTAREVVNDYEAANDAKDFLCDSMISNYDRQLTSKDSLLVLREGLYSQTRTALNLAQKQTTDLLDYGKSMRNEVRKRKFGGLVWKLVAIGEGLFILQSQIKL